MGGWPFPHSTKQPVAKFLDWLAEAPKGHKYAYYVGFLAADREYIIPLDTRPKPRYGHVFVEPANSLGTEAMAAYEQGRVHLTQERMGPGRWIYWATKRK